MKLFLRAICVGFGVLALLAGGGRVLAADGDLIEVFIDAREPAYVVFQGVAENTSPLARQEMAGYATLEGVSLVTWGRFRDNVQDFVSAGIVKNEFPGPRTARGVLAMLKARPGRPIAITWNGGIATSFFDFQHAVETLQAFREDAEKYERERAIDLAEDPLNPDLHLRVLQGG